MEETQKIAVDEEEVIGGEEEEQDKVSVKEGYPKGIIPVWRPQKILPYSLDLIPPNPQSRKPPPTISMSDEALPTEEEGDKPDSINLEGSKHSSTKLERIEEVPNGNKKEDAPNSIQEDPDRDGNITTSDENGGEQILGEYHSTRFDNTNHDFKS